MIPETEKLSADVLVLGGGLAGCMGAIAAAQKGRSVVLVDKAWVGGSGESTFAAGDILWFDPAQDDMREWLERYNKAGASMFDPEWLEWYCHNVHDLVLLLDAWGMEFEKDEKGRFKRKPGRGHNEAVVFPGYKMQKKLRGILEKLGVTIIDRVMVTQLLTANGHVVGATGFQVRTGKFYVFEAKNTVLSTGACSYKGQYHGQDMVCGEGNDMALRIGAEFTNMEFSNTYNGTAKDFDICGMSRFQRLGGRFTNARGETFMERYDPEHGEGAILHIVVQAMTKEVRAGRGPIYFDLKGMSPEDKELSKRIIPMFFEACESKGVDPFTEPVEWIPGFMGSTSCGSGLTLRSFACDTTVPGLFAAGDTANQGLVMGALAGPGGINLGWALVTGWNAGQGAAAACDGINALAVDEAQIAAARAATFAKLGHQGDMSLGEAIYRIQSLVIPAKYNILRTGASLREALEGLDEAERDIEARIAVRDTHELMLYHELHGMLSTAKLTFVSALQREESRGSHYREDFTEIDGSHWNVWLKTSLQDGKLAVKTEPIPVEKFQRYGLDVYPK